MRYIDKERERLERAGPVEEVSADEALAAVRWLRPNA